MQLIQSYRVPFPLRSPARKVVVVVVREAMGDGAFRARELCRFNRVCHCGAGAAVAASFYC